MLSARGRRPAQRRIATGPSSPSMRPSILPYDNPIAELDPGDLFGEMTCMSYYPRSATVRAEDRLRHARDAAQRARHPAAEQDIPGAARTELPRARARHPPAQRARLLVAHARTSSITCASASSWSATPGQVICRQGDLADSFYPGPHRLRQSVRGTSRRRTRAARTSPAAATSARSACSAGARAPPPARRSTTWKSCGSAPRTSDSMLERFPDVRATLEAVARERAGDRISAAQRKCRRCRSINFSPGPDGGAEPAGARPGALHALR